MLSSLKSLIASTSHHSKSTYFLRLYISEEEMISGCTLGLHSWSDSGCSVKHAYVDEFVEVKSVNVTEWTYILGSIYNLPIDHVLYIFDKEDVTVVLLEHNNTI